jgi:hypothetical protein
MLAALDACGLSRSRRLPLAVVFYGTSTGFFQWRDKT